MHVDVRLKFPYWNPAEHRSMTEGKKKGNLLIMLSWADQELKGSRINKKLIIWIQVNLKRLNSLLFNYFRCTSSNSVGFSFSSMLHVLFLRNLWERFYFHSLNLVPLNMMLNNFLKLFLSLRGFVKKLFTKFSKNTQKL